MTDTLMTIREMCETFDVTPRTLRFYEAKELLYPIRDGQKRLFTRRDRGRLKLILRGKRFGFSLEDIRQLLDLYDMDDQHQVQIREVVARSRERLAEMRRQRDDLDTLISELAEMIDMGDRLMAEKAKTSE
ncbi:MerR family DNA-binding transcriptional regulator [Defluviimonas sp. WL0024]|uniref:MerR family DNA-binding transcriptional regulator n=2 Tax=Albidovulum TaxID=205889 RepID=A0ABT3J8W8_9RHOB|nr:MULTISPECIES: MerR family DNA-binding transcriptional regulator [Defluviimonas]MCU9850322.1 MerR family DNA-binding transcriptional regulator [Defluviimonas sp. WL0024]MCW3784106.1 MerR family DNA-binding transcriptional regulator [Defluviimonas salinarum]